MEHISLRIRNKVPNMRSSVDTPETLGVVLREARHQRRLSQEELAQNLGVSQRYISELENGKPGILMNRLFRILRELGVDLSAEIKRDGGSRD